MKTEKSGSQNLTCLTIGLSVQSLMYFLYTHFLQSCMVICSTEKVACHSTWKRWRFLRAIVCIGLSLVFKLDAAFFLHDYWTHSADRIIYFLQYISTLQKLVFLYNTHFFQMNWGTECFDILFHVWGLWILLSLSLY